MIKVENTDVWGFEHAVRGMRNSYGSWDKIDSFWCKGDVVTDEHCESCIYYKAFNENVKVCWRDWLDDAGYIIGKNDLELMQKLIKAGQSHRKFLRQLFVSMDITAPLYWWKEFDVYKVGTVANSCSTMHSIHKKEFVLNDFSYEHLNFVTKGCLEGVINQLNICREYYMQDKDKDSWWQMIQLLPSSYNQRRTVTMNYENVLNIIEQRANHKLDEWVEFVIILKKLPYIEALIKRD